MLVLDRFAAHGVGRLCFTRQDNEATIKAEIVGQIIQQGQGLMVIVPLKDVWVTANFKETQLRDVHAGQKAEVKVDLGGKTYPGHVDSIAGATGTRMSAARMASKPTVCSARKA